MYQLPPSQLINDASLKEEEVAAAVALRLANMRRCMLLLLAKGAIMPREATDGEREVVRLIIQDAVTLFLVPFHANEAVFGPAPEASRKRKGPEP